MRILLLAACFLVAADVVHAGDPPSPAQVRAWERALLDAATPAAGAEVRRTIAELKPAVVAVEIVRTWLGAAHAQLRIDGARTAQAMGTAAEPLIAPLLEGLRDRQAGVRAAAAEALGASAGTSTQRRRVLARLAHALDDKQATVRASALMGLVALQGVAEDEVLDRLLDAEAGFATIGALLDRKSASATTVAALLRGRSRNLREMVLRVMWERLHASRKSAPVAAWTPLALERLQQDRSGAVRRMALGVLGSGAREGDETRQAVALGLRDRDALVRAAAYRIADARALVADPAIAMLLMVDLELAERRLRASAAWLLRAAPPRWPGLREALRTLLAKGGPEEARNAAAALLDRGHTSERLMGHLTTFVAEAGVPQPYPEPDLYRDLGTGGGGKRSDPPSFFPNWTWNAARLEAAGKAAVPALVTALRSAKKKDRLTWIHALAFTGRDGVAALLGEHELFGAFERLIVAVIRAHAGSTDEALIGELIAAAAATPGEVDTEEPVIGPTDTPLRRGLLALDALERIGKPAIPALERAAARAGSGDRFKEVLERMK